MKKLNQIESEFESIMKGGPMQYCAHLAKDGESATQLHEEWEDRFNRLSKGKGEIVDRREQYRDKMGMLGE